MQNKPLRTGLPLQFVRRLSLPIWAVAGLALIGAPASRAQTNSATLSLSPVVATAASGSISTFTVSLTGGTNLGYFDLNVLLDPNYLSFVGTAPFISAASNPFSSQLIDSLSSTGDLRASYGTFGAAVDNTGKTTVLGTFQVDVLKTLPTAGTALSFGPVGSANTGGSEVADASTGANVLKGTTGARLNPPAAIPEASQGTVLGLCLLGLGGLAFTARRRSAQR